MSTQLCAYAKFKTISTRVAFDHYWVTDCEMSGGENAPYFLAWRRNMCGCSESVLQDYVQATDRTVSIGTHRIINSQWRTQCAIWQRSTLISLSMKTHSAFFSSHSCPICPCLGVWSWRSNHEGLTLDNVGDHQRGTAVIAGQTSTGKILFDLEGK